MYIFKIQKVKDLDFAHTGVAIDCNKNNPTILDVWWSYTCCIKSITVCTPNVINLHFAAFYAIDMTLRSGHVVTVQAL